LVDGTMGRIGRMEPMIMGLWDSATHYAPRERTVVVGWDYGTHGTHGTYDYGTMGRGDCFVGDYGTAPRTPAPCVFCVPHPALIVKLGSKIDNFAGFAWYFLF